MSSRTHSAAERLGPWFHNLHLPNGVQTAEDHALGDFHATKWQVLAPHLPERLDGWSALDIGCNAGFYSFELARRGAHVTGIDVDPHYLQQAQWAAGEFGLLDQITFRQAQVYDLARSEERYDLVLFMGVFYHLRYPLLGLDIVARRVGRLMVFQSLTAPSSGPPSDTSDRALNDRNALNETGWPRMMFVEGRFAGDPTNWWIPNEPAVAAMIRSSGMEVIASPGHELHLCVPAAANASTRAPFDITPELLAASGRSSRTG